MHKKILYLVTLFLIIGCGYKIYENTEKENPKFTYKLISVDNISSDPSIVPDVKRVASQFIPLDNTSGNLLSISIKNYKIFTKEVGISDDAVKSSIFLTLNFQIMDSNGYILFDKDIKGTENFDVDRTISAFNNNRNIALDEVIKDILTKFRYEFESQ